MQTKNPLERLRHHVSGAIARGEATAITEVRAVMQTTTLPKGTQYQMRVPTGQGNNRRLVWASKALKSDTKVHVKSLNQDGFDYYEFLTGGVFRLPAGAA